MNIQFFLQTDPANLDYEIVSGARRQEKRFKAEDNGTVVPDEKVMIKREISWGAISENFNNSENFNSLFD